MMTTFDTATTADVALLKPDGRTTLAKLLSQFDSLYDPTKAAERAFQNADRILGKLKAQIKDEVRSLRWTEVNLDHPDLRYLLSYRAGYQRRMSEANIAAFKEDYPGLYLKYSTEIPTATIRRLTGPQWLKPEVR